MKRSDPNRLPNDPATLADKVMVRCDELARLTEEPGRITRRYLSEPMVEVHSRLREWMLAAGLTPRVDHAGNLIARRRSEGAKRTLLIGSHLDSVPGGGRYDGVLGVLIGLAVAESLGKAPLPFHLDVIGFSEEEGVRFNKPYLGSAAIAGDFQPEWLDRRDEEGKTLREAIAWFGLDPNRIDEAGYHPDGVVGFVEPHLEQGPVLERAGSPVGLVSGIVGQTRMRVEFCGEAAHAGTTPMTGRHDALVCAAEMVRVVKAIGLKSNDLRATIGRLRITPNAPNVIAERVELSLDVRHPEDPQREKAINEFITAGRLIAEAEGCRFEVLENAPQKAVAVDPGLSESLAGALHETGQEPIRLPSGAGHDAVAMASRFPVAMLFLRHPGGVSHHPDERVEQRDVAVAIEVLDRFLLRLAEKESNNA